MESGNRSLEQSLVKLSGFVKEVRLAMRANSCVGAPFRSRIERLLTTVEEVYDLENGGARSFGGVVMGNVRVLHDRLSVSACSKRQENLWKFFETGMDLTAFSGMRHFLHKMLTQDERKRLVEQLDVLLREGVGSPSNSAEMTYLVCSDRLVKKKQHEAVQRRRFRCTYRGGGGDGVMVKVGALAPVLSPNLCSDPARVTKVVPLKPHLQQMVSFTMNRFRRNFAEIQRVLKKSLLQPKSSTPRSDLTVDNIRGAEIGVKRAVVAFLLQSIVDFKNVANTIRF